jgi:hypothetical protein
MGRPGSNGTTSGSKPALLDALEPDSLELDAPGPESPAWATPITSNNDIDIDNHIDASVAA